MNYPPDANVASIRPRSLRTHRITSPCVNDEGDAWNKTVRRSLNSIAWRKSIRRELRDFGTAARVFRERIRHNRTVSISIDCARKPHRKYPGIQSGSRSNQGFRLEQTRFGIVIPNCCKEVSSLAICLPLKIRIYPADEFNYLA